jgi:hypothetical protein
MVIESLNLAEQHCRTRGGQSTDIFSKRERPLDDSKPVHVHRMGKTDGFGDGIEPSGFSRFIIMIDELFGKPAPFFVGLARDAYVLQKGR